MQTLTSERLVLRMFRESDLDAYAEMCGDALVMRYIGDGHTLSRDEAWRSMALIIGHWHLRGFGMWAVEERRSGLFAGRVGCWQPEGWPGVEIGWALHRRFWGKGYATEAGLQAIDFAFNQLGQCRVISLIQPENSGSVAVALRLGMRIEQDTELMGKRVLMYALNGRRRVSS